MKAIGVLVIGLGLILMVIGVMGTQHQVLADLKAVNPKLRAATQTPSQASIQNPTTGTNPNPGENPT